MGRRVAQQPRRGEQHDSIRREPGRRGVVGPDGRRGNGEGWRLRSN
jgi:hypothetical protein